MILINNKYTFLKNIFSLLFIILIVLFLSSCSFSEESYEYIEYDEKQFIKQLDGVYKNENDYVYFLEEEGKTIIRMSFSDVQIDILPEKDPKVTYPDGCYMYFQMSNNGFLTGYGPGPGGKPHFHDYDFASLAFAEIHNSGIEKQERQKAYLPLIILFTLFAIYNSFFVFKPRNVRKILIFKNSFFPLHKEPYEPSELNIGINYISNVFFLIISIYFIFTFLTYI